MTTRVFLSNAKEWHYSLVREIEEAIEQLNKGEKPVGVWICRYITSLAVGDKTYFKRVGSQPLGFFAHGTIVKVNEGTITYEWDSVVNYDQPLDISMLREKPEFTSAFFDYRSSGHSFREEYVEPLDNEWEKYSAKLSKVGKGARIADVYHKWAQEKTNQQLYEEAVKYYTQAIENSFNNFEAFYNRGLVLAKLKQYKQALKDITRALIIEPRYADAYYNRALIYSEPEIANEPAAIEDLQKAAELYKQYKWEDKYLEAWEFIQVLTKDTTSNSSFINKKENVEEPKKTFDDSTSEEIRQESETTENLEIAAAQKQLDTEEFFTPKSPEEANKRNIISIARRQGQYEFRKSLLEIYNYRCAISECDVQEALEAAHIIPYVETENNHPSNGLLLRADLHTLFDLNLITIDPEKIEVNLDPSLRQSSYGQLHGKPLQLPQNKLYWPKKDALERRCEQCNWYK